MFVLVLVTYCETETSSQTSCNKSSLWWLAVIPILRNNVSHPLLVLKP